MAEAEENNVPDGTVYIEDKAVNQEKENEEICKNESNSEEEGETDKGQCDIQNDNDFKQDMEDGKKDDAEEKEDEKEEDNTLPESVDSGYDNGDNEKICKKDDDGDEDDLMYVESGSDFEDNLNEKWKNLVPGTRLKRYLILNLSIKK